LPYKRRASPTYVRKRRTPPQPSPSARKGRKEEITGGKVLPELTKAPSDLHRKLIFMGYLTKWLARKGVECIIVGGEAVEVYTGGQFTTGDIAIVVSNREKTEQLLAKAGFKERGRIWVSPEYGIAVDIVSSIVAGKTERTRTIEVSDVTVRLEAIEDLIVGRLVSAKYWKGTYQLDLEQAAVLLANFPDLDKEYLKQRIKEQHVEDIYRKVAAKANELAR
jgi:hypothetical protein